MATNERKAPPLLGAEEQILNELELQVITYFVVDALALSVREKQLDFKQAEDSVVLWFPGDKVALTALYKQLHNQGG